MLLSIKKNRCQSLNCELKGNLGDVMLQVSLLFEPPSREGRKGYFFSCVNLMPFITHPQLITA